MYVNKRRRNLEMLHGHSVKWKQSSARTAQNASQLIKDLWRLCFLNGNLSFLKWQQLALITRVLCVIMGSIRTINVLLRMAGAGYCRVLCTHWCRKWPCTSTLQVWTISTDESSFLLKLWSPPFPSKTRRNICVRIKGRTSLLLLSWWCIQVRYKHAVCTWNASVSPPPMRPDPP